MVHSVVTFTVNETVLFSLATVFGIAIVIVPESKAKDLAFVTNTKAKEISLFAKASRPYDLYFSGDKGKAKDHTSSRMSTDSVFRCALHCFMYNIQVAPCLAIMLSEKKL